MKNAGNRNHIFKRRTKTGFINCEARWKPI